VSFGSSQSVKNNQNTLAGATNQATGNSTNEINSGNTQLNTGGQNITSGTNFLNTALNGNQANTTALLQPNINQIRQANQQTLQGINTLSPRGGGRSGTNYAATFAPNQQIQSLFGNARTAAASALPQVGLAQQGIGANLVGAGNNALSTGVQGANASTQNALQVQQMSNQIDAAIGSGLFGLATTPLGIGGTSGGGGSILGSVINCWIAEAVYGQYDIRTHVVRQWLNVEYARTKIGRVVMSIYRKIGRQVVPYVRGPVRWVLKPLFDIALRKALA
jgi:hypothetical protein